jgi:uncharacterized iron-regulated membrane protein
MTFRKLLGTLHLWLGLASGLVVMVVGLTGALLTFEQELSELTGTGSSLAVPARSEPLARPSQVFAAARPHLPDSLKRLYYSHTPAEEKAAVLWALDTQNRWTSLLHDPYTGAMLKNAEYGGNVWSLLLDVHTRLLLPPRIGHLVVGTATLVLVALLVSGIVLWWPKNRSAARQRIWFRWKRTMRWKRRNYDLHTVLGFYASGVAVFIALTGLVWSFEWVSSGVYWLATGDTTSGRQKTEQPLSMVTAHAVRLPAQVLDAAYQQVQAAYHEPVAVTVHYPLTPTATLHFTVQPTARRHLNARDELSYDQYSGALVQARHWANQNAGERLRSLNGPIHFGTLLGLPGKLLVFFASLLTASLPVSGFCIWWGRRPKAPPRSAVHPPQPIASTSIFR